MEFNKSDDDIVISGISVRLPKSFDANEFSNNLYNKVDMTGDCSRWSPDISDMLPKRFGFVDGAEKFDATFFGIHSKQASTMDPQCRMLLEQTYAAIMDAGIHPFEFRGTNTGVFSACSSSESESYLIYEKLYDTGFAAFGCSRNMIANRVSFCMDLRGPSFTVDSACSGSLIALDTAFETIKSGKCDAAIVCATNLIILPNTSLGYGRLGILALDGVQQPFDKDAHGYVRSEGIIAMLVQRRKDAKRIYAQIAHTKVNNDGNKPEGITHPNALIQQDLLKSFYTDINLNPKEISYVEAHMTGTKAGDPEECEALDMVFCKDRQKPLPVGSVKSNLGHTEAAAGLVSIAKAILIFQCGLIPPNLNYKEPPQHITSLVEGRLKVVLETTPIAGPLIGINAFGFGGTNAHTLLIQSDKVKINHGRPNDNLPRLVTWSGRTTEAVNTVLEKLSALPLDAEFIGLLHNSQRHDAECNLYKGFGIYRANEDPSKPAECIVSEISYFDQVKRPVVWLLSGMGSAWIGMGKAFMELQLFRDSIKKCHDVLTPFGIDLISIITSDDEQTFERILNAFVGINSIQIALIDILWSLKAPVDFIIGHSMGEITCGYADGTLTLEQTILCAYYRGKVSEEINTIKGSMAAVAMNYEEIKNILPKEVYVACRNSHKSVTISGPTNEVRQFIMQLKRSGKFAKELEHVNIAYHSKHIAAFGPTVLTNLKTVIQNPKKRSSKWLSTSVPESEWNMEKCTYSSAEYYVNNLLNPVLFEDTLKLLPRNSIVIEIAPRDLMRNIIKSAMPNIKYVSLSKRNNHNFDSFLTALGELSLNGISLRIDHLYPAINFPVSRGTPMIAPLIKWDHTQDWFVAQHDEKKKDIICEHKLTISLLDDEYKYIKGHIVDDRCLIPGLAYLQFVREMLVSMIPTETLNTAAIEFENVSLKRATAIKQAVPVELLIIIHNTNGQFNIYENDTVVIEGVVRYIKNPKPIADLKKYYVESDSPILKQDDFYKELGLWGYKHNGLFRSVQECRADGSYSKIKWTKDNWVVFMDCLLQTHIAKKDSRGLFLPTEIRKIRINPLQHFEILDTLDSVNPIFEAYSSSNLDMIVGGGIELSGVQVTAVARRKTNGTDVLETYQFIPLNCIDIIQTTRNAARIFTQLALEKLCVRNVKFVEVLRGDEKPNIGYFQEAFSETMLVLPELIVLTQNSFDNLKNVEFENAPLNSLADCTFILATDCIENVKFHADLEQSLSKTGYLILIENTVMHWDDIKAPKGFETISAIKTLDKTWILLQRRLSTAKSEYPSMVKIDSNDTSFKWLENINREIKKHEILLFEQNDFSGIIGLTNCLRLEPGFEQVRCALITDSSSFDSSFENMEFKSQLALNLPINVYKDGKWGTYRHLLLDQQQMEKQSADHLFLKIQRSGDLSTLGWATGPLNRKDPKNIINIQYVSLNFRDLMLATRRINPESLIESRFQRDSYLGTEFSGIMYDGTRFMGMIAASSTQIDIDCAILRWKVPDYMKLREAATIPTVYATVYLAFFIDRKISKGDTVLIHSGAGGVGLAAIRVALAYGLTVFTTVSTEKKKRFLLELFPNLEENHIGYSRDCSFEEMVMHGTNARGVDFVLNSLTEEKLLASFRCLHKRGTFLELGKFDMYNNTTIGMRLFHEETVFRIVAVDTLGQRPAVCKIVHDLVQRDLDLGIIQPLPSTVFPMNETENAFRYLSSGKHIGKVLIQVRESEKSPLSMPVRIIPQYYFDPKMVYLLVGGLGGFGLELADWLVIRGAKNIVLSSRRGILTGYQAFRIGLWKSYGCKVIINTSDVTTLDGCEKLLRESASYGHIGGIFNLAVVLRDGIFENQTSTSFFECYAAKASATFNLDKLSRKLCEKLELFVVFSSVSCGRGNAGQTNYGMSNSIMERIIEKRIKDKLPGKAIQWGAVGDVGIVAEKITEKVNSSLLGALPQPIESCLNVMDLLLFNSQPIVSSMVIAQKQKVAEVDAFNTVLNIIGISDVKSISINSTLSNLGMDSLTSIEIKQVLEREFGVIQSLQELRDLTVAQLQQVSQTNRRQIDEKEMKQIALFQGTKNLGDENLCTTDLVKLPANDKDIQDNFILFIPGIEGVLSSNIKTLCSKINKTTVVMQLFNSMNKTTLSDLVSHAIENIKELYRHKNYFHIIGYSFGAVVAVEIAKELERAGLRGHLTLIDGSLSLFKKFLSEYKFSELSEQENTQLSFMMHSFFVNEHQKQEFEANLRKQLDWNEKMNICVNCLPNNNYSSDYLKATITAVFNRISLLRNAEINTVPKLISSIALFRPKKAMFNDIDDDYELSQYSMSNKVHVNYVDGDHHTILANLDLIDMINQI